ncbi:hypothetical protein [Kineococcus terrestris]|uniref:hypothetical protein n=1 Tax=Kineococcus terrestris TaxID=2044856 RepID=UPI0034DAFCC7
MTPSGTSARAAEQLEPVLHDVRRQSPVTAETVRRRVADPAAPVLVDFDHTLFASNSTEMFIAHCRPSLVVALIDLLVRVLVPWRLVPRGRGHRVGDWLCVALIVLLTPWNVRRWRRDAPALFERHRARAVCGLFAGVDPARLTIISFGMAFVVRALVARSEFAAAALVATPALPRPSWFAGGKTATATAAVGADGVARAVFVSDSLHDEDLLLAAGTGLLVTPQGAALSARERLYVPLRYTARVKYSRLYTLDQFLLVDAAVVVLAVGYDLPSVLRFALVVPLLLLSLMAVYEIGYHENDVHAANFEERPVLDPQVSRYLDYPIRTQAWVWALGAAAAALGVAVALGELAREELLRAGLSWLVLLVVLRAVFWAYNRVRVHARVFLYPVLQVLKYGAVFLVFVPTTVGVVLVLSQVMAMWAVYVVYRLGGRKEDLDRDLFGSVAFLVAAALLLMADLVHGGLSHEGAGHASIAETTFALALLWALARTGKGPLMRRLRTRAAV